MIVFHSLDLQVELLHSLAQLIGVGIWNDALALDLGFLMSLDDPLLVGILLTHVNLGWWSHHTLVGPL